MQFLLNPQVQIFFQLLLAAILGGLVGLEREYNRKSAGLRTHALVCMGSALFVIISAYSFSNQIGTSFDPSRVAAGIVMGVGFLGAGIIMHHNGRVEGLTTAAGIWAVAAIGLAVGVKMYLTATVAAVLILGILILLRILEEKVFGNKEE